MATKLPAETVRLITETACACYQERLDKAVQENKDNRLHNTKLLLERYQELKAFSENAVYDAQQVAELQTITELMGMTGRSSALIVESLESSTAKTSTLISHIDKMLDFYREHNEEPRRWSVVKGMYLDNPRKKAGELADMLFCDESTIYRLNRAAIKDLSTLFFGVILE